MTFVEKTMNELKVLALAGIVVIITQFIALDGGLNIMQSIIGMLCIILISIVSLKIKSVLPLPIPAFAWASLLALLLTTPISPVAPFLLEVTGQISTGQIGTVILAAAGISIGCRLDDIKKLSWKIILVAFVVFCGTFFGSALISQIILKIQGII